MQRLRTSAWGQGLALVTGALVPVLHLAVAVHFLLAPHRYCDEHARLEAGTQGASAASATPVARSDATVAPRPNEHGAPHGSGDPHSACSLMGVCEARAVTGAVSAVLLVASAAECLYLPDAAPSVAARVDLLAAPKQSPPAPVASC